MARVGEREIHRCTSMCTDTHIRRMLTIISLIRLFLLEKEAQNTKRE